MYFEGCKKLSCIQRKKTQKNISRFHCIFMESLQIFSMAYKISTVCEQISEDNQMIISERKYLQTKSKFYISGFSDLWNSIRQRQGISKCLHNLRLTIIVPYISTEPMHTRWNTCSEKPWMCKKSIFWRLYYRNITYFMRNY